MKYQQELALSKDDPEGFWRKKSEALEWFKKPEKILTQDKDGIHHWFADGEMNTAYMALDYHVENGRADQAALIYDSPVTNTKKTYTYREMRDEVALIAGMLVDLGVEKGDRVIVYMPMIPQAAMAMLACARIGAIHSVVFGGFAAPELALRIDDAKPKVILSASCGIEINRVIEYKPLIDNAVEIAKHTPNNVVVFQRPEATAELSRDGDLDWVETVSKAQPAGCTPVKGSDLLYILYTSGTTGKPKGVVRENGGHAVAMKYSMSAIYDMKPGEVFWSASDVGWVVGHSYIVYAPLLQGCTTIFFEGKPIMTPDAGAFWRVISEHKVKALFTAPTAFRAIKKEDPNGDFIKKYDLSSFKTLFAAGERLDPPTYEWLDEQFKLPIIDNWWQTETGWPISSNMRGIEKMPIKPGSSTVPVPGYDIHILDDNGQEVAVNKQGNIAIKLPLPPSCLTTIWGDINRFKASYLETFPGYYTSGDGGYIDEDGYLFVMGRTDDVINVSGHRLSTGEMEEIIATHPAVAECAVIGRSDDLKGQMPLGFTILKSGVDTDHSDIKKALVQLMREKIGAVACYKDTIIVERLPKTRSGKILRKTLRQLVDGEDYVIPSTIDDPAILDEIQQELK
ncbi:propionyl-CoA synthetase [Candidatus Thioglobus sp.]|nr:propionyl-CoA synthetase [Candidatus Thioglobus sp.]MDC0388808.1 propionyl-CoA synthetase [Candidatus Thioglobus sp.]MDC0904375.1 propionyl-CoA synthetase [Candidatus Thioglobus sp.]MDC0919902.1 propionyl-CoA synthetase [Candidatus Thioglobus sp.]MDC0965067.1 propionyl-CoA synthetase [Candidatus Thioglobus sp.]